MTEIIRLDRILSALEKVDVVAAVEAGFIAYAQGAVVVPPVGELCFEEPPGEAHIKYGYIRNDDFYVVKIASGFYQNPDLGLASSQGVMLVFCQKTGYLKAVLLDNGYLTDIRTAAAGAVAARYLAPEKVDCIGILGTGIQGRLQLAAIGNVIECNQAMVWAPSTRGREAYLAHFEEDNIAITFCDEPRQIAANCNLIVTTTPSKTPLLRDEDIRIGTHITAVGSDTPEKIELDPDILKRADLVVADSLSQSLTRGEIHRAVQAGVLDRSGVIELGNIAKGVKARGSEDITVADLTGVAVQDIQIATAVYRQVQSEKE